MALCFSALAAQAQQAKYVFYFIGDGMGNNHVYATNLFLKQQQQDALLFPTFPVLGLASTYSQSNDITDSAAAGTALATGTKTSNGTISMDADHDNALRTLGESATLSDKAVGIVTSVSVDHATPAVFYAHQPSRRQAYEIASSLSGSGVDFLAGGGFVEPRKKGNANAPLVYDLFEADGYTVFRGEEAYDNRKQDAEKVILIQEEGKNPSSLPNVIDDVDDALTLPYLTRQAIDHLKNKQDGFFLMVEGGMIDWASHSNDIATAIHEVKDFDQAIRLAYDFYKQKPDSTLIVVTADHETGGLSMGRKGYVMHIDALAEQKISQGMLSKIIEEMRVKAHESGQPIQWDALKELLKDKMGFWDEIELSEEQEDRLRALLDTMNAGKDKAQKSEYYVDQAMSKLAIAILAEVTNVAWGTTGHSAAQVPVYAIGVGSDAFTGLMDNTDIPRRIRRVADYK